MPISFRSGSEYEYSALLRRLSTTSVLLVCRHGHAVRRVGAFRHGQATRRQIRILDAVDLFVRREVDDRESIEGAQLSKYPLGRAVRIGRRRSSDGCPDPASSVQTFASVAVSNTLIVLRLDGAGDDVACRPGVTYGIVNAAFGRKRLQARQRRGVDDIDAARRFDDADIDLGLPSLAMAMLLGMAAQLDLLHDFQRLRIDDVAGAHRFVADVDAAAIRATVAPWFASMPSITPMTVLVAGSIT